MCNAAVCERATKEVEGGGDKGHDGRDGAPPVFRRTVLRELEIQIAGTGLISKRLQAGRTAVIWPKDR